MELIQSFLLSVTRVRLSLYEQRILTKIVEHGQTVVRGLAVQQYKHVTNPFDNESITVPIRYIMTDGSKDYNKVINACKALMSRKFEFFDPETRTYYADTVVHNVVHVVGSGKVSFMVSRVLYDVMFNFSMGYKNYDLEEALQLPTPYAVRMYVLLNNQTRPIEWGVEQLKEMFGVADKYKQTADFIKKVIEPARIALANNKTNGFTYGRIREGNKVVKLRFYPVKVEKQEEVMYKDLTREQLTQYKAIQIMMTNDCAFTWKEITANRTTVTRFSSLIGAVDLMMAIVQRSKRKQMDKGYIINAMKSEYKHADARMKIKQP